MAKKTAAPKLSDADQVSAYMAQLEHPLKAETEILRSIIRQAHPAIQERIKWNAPSYYTGADLLTFNFRAPDALLLVFHHPTIVQIQSPLLEGDYKDRRLMYFRGPAAVEAQREELERILKLYVELASNA